MLIELFEISALLIVLILPFVLPYRKKAKTIKINKNHNDTSEANYAINEHGFLEEIHHEGLKSHVDYQVLEQPLQNWPKAFYFNNIYYLHRAYSIY